MYHLELEIAWLCDGRFCRFDTKWHDIPTNTTDRMMDYENRPITNPWFSLFTMSHPAWMDGFLRGVYLASVSRLVPSRGIHTRWMHCVSLISGRRSPMPSVAQLTHTRRLIDHYPLVIRHSSLATVSATPTSPRGLQTFQVYKSIRSPLYSLKYFVFTTKGNTPHAYMRTHVCAVSWAYAAEYCQRNLVP
jgi:hypothetical protein